jgi:hypothetical protein
MNSNSLSFIRISHQLIGRIFPGFRGFGSFETRGFDL